MDSQEQEDELLALQSIFSGDEFVRKESKAAGEIRVCVELPADFRVAIKQGKTCWTYGKVDFRVAIKQGKTCWTWVMIIRLICNESAAYSQFLK